MILLDEVDSTNTYAKRHFDNLADGTLVSARMQTAGRGRLGRSWLSGRDRDITATFILKNISDGFHAGVICGLAVLKLIREYAPGSLSFLKWPNDIYIREKKICGILSEGVISDGRLAGVVCGFGVNVNSTENDLFTAGQPATSLHICTGRNFDVEKLTERLEKYLFECYIKFNLDFPAVMEEWRRENRLVGHPLEAVDPAGTRITGVFSRIDDDGAMILAQNGGEARFLCGDIKIDVAGTDWEKMSREIAADKAVEAAERISVVR